jgi:hypothetical protein
MSPAADFPLPELAAILAGVPWAMAGAVAANRYMPQRATMDVDVVVLPGDHDEVSRRLSQANYRREGSLAIGGSSWRAPDGTLLDVIHGNESWWPEALAVAGSLADSSGIPVLAARHVVLMKLLSSRLQDVADVSRILGFMDDRDLEEVRSLVLSEAPGLGDDLESLITLGKLEHQA